MPLYNDPAYKIVDTPSGPVRARLQPFIFGLPLVFAAVANGLSVTGTIQVDPGLPFILTEMLCEADNDTTTTTAPASRFLLFNITSGESQQLFANGVVPRFAMFGSPDLPRVLPVEIQIRPSDTLTVTCTNNTGGALTTTVRVSLRGFKLVSPEKITV